MEVRNKWIEDNEEEWPADHPAVAAVAAAVGAYAAANPPSQPLEHGGGARSLLPQWAQAGAYTRPMFGSP